MANRKPLDGNLRTDIRKQILDILKLKDKDGKIRYTPYAVCKGSDINQSTLPRYVKNETGEECLNDTTKDKLGAWIKREGLL